MSDAAPNKRAEPPRDTLSRLGRLTLKELRETLRDRRTIVTLVLMPLLVYPLLSLAFKQFLLSSFQQQGQTQWRIGVATEPEGVVLLVLLRRGDELLKQAEQPPQGSASQDAARASKSGEDGNSAEPAVEELAVFTTENLDEAVNHMQVDLGVRVRPRPPGEVPWRQRMSTLL